jgi:uncharacterized protein YcgI (DUF1989 family)
MATVVADTVAYGYDADGAGCHDLLGTRCDPYVHKLLTGQELDCCCHSNLVRAIAPFRLAEEAHQYSVKPCPAKAGDYFEFFAEIDLLAAISTCPHGDMSVPIWGPNAADPLDVCRPLDVEVYTLDARLLSGWRSPAVADYAGLHGMKLD